MESLFGAEYLETVEGLAFGGKTLADICYWNGMVVECDWEPIKIR